VSTSSPSTRAPASPEDSSGAEGTGIVVVVVVVVGGIVVATTGDDGVEVLAIDALRLDVRGASAKFVLLESVCVEGSTFVVGAVVVVGTVVGTVVVVGATLNTARLKTAVSELDAPLLGSIRRAVIV
jgi:hypothetical protein